jgi:hypothetical protein
MLHPLETKETNMARFNIGNTKRKRGGQLKTASQAVASAPTMPRKPPEIAAHAFQRLLGQQVRLANYCYGRAATAFQQGRDNLGLSFAATHKDITRTIAPYLAPRMLAINPNEGNTRADRPMAYVVDPISADQWAALYGSGATKVIDGTAAQSVVASANSVSNPNALATPTATPKPTATASATPRRSPTPSPPAPPREGPQRGEGEAKPPDGTPR